MNASALSGVLGALVGGLFASGATYWQDWRQGRKAARTAERLASADLTAAGAVLAIVVKDMRSGKTWPKGHDTKRWADSWAGYRGVLAASMDDEPFGAIATAFGTVEQLQNGLAAPGHAFVDTDPPFLMRVQSALADAAPALAGGKRFLPDYYERLTQEEVDRLAACIGARPSESDS